MQRRTLLIGGAAAVLFLLVAMQVFAQEPGPGTNPIYATIEYVAQEVARLDARIDGIGGGGTEEHFDVPPTWNVTVWETCPGSDSDTECTGSYEGPYMNIDFWPGGNCVWHEQGLGYMWSAPPTRYYLQHPVVPGAVLHGVGNCFGIYGSTPNRPDLLLPSEATFQVHVEYFWMGTMEYQDLAVECGPLTGSVQSDRHMQCTAIEMQN